MSVIYQSNSATSDNQDVSNALLTQIKDAVNLLSGTTEPQELVVLNSILTALTGAATSAKQDTGNTSLASILSTLASQATAANQATGNASLASILANMATAANQTAGNTALASILSGMATAALQNTINSSITAMSAKLTGGTASAITSVTQSPSSQPVLASNANRKGLYLYNDSGAKCFVAFAATASQTAFTFILAANSGYESPQAKVYTGAMSVIWQSGNTGALRVTEIT